LVLLGIENVSRLGSAGTSFGGPSEGEAITWAGDRLFVWGGVRWDAGEPTILAAGWIWKP
jgi:hypothetical protein